MNPLITKRCSPVEEAIYQDGYQAGAASRDAEVAELVTALEHILAGSLSLPRFAEAEAIAVIAKVRKP